MGFAYIRGRVRAPSTQLFQRNFSKNPRRRANRTREISIGNGLNGLIDNDAVINFAALINLHIRRVEILFEYFDRLLFTSCSHVYFHYRVIDSIYSPRAQILLYYNGAFKRINRKTWQISRRI